MDLPTEEVSQPPINLEFRLLSTWNQFGARTYTRKAYCFPYHPSSTQDLKSHLATALSHLSQQTPDLAGRLFLTSNPKGRLILGTHPSLTIPLDIEDSPQSFAYTYAQLKARGFPAQCFVHPFFDYPFSLVEDDKTHGRPVFRVLVRIIEGGLLLCTYNHHALVDGTGIEALTQRFADLTRGIRPASPIPLLNFHLDLPSPITSPSGLRIPSDFSSLLTLCPEFSLLPTPIGPQQPHIFLPGVPITTIPKTGRIIAFSKAPILALKQRLLPQACSTFACLAALTWAHVTKARLSISTQLEKYGNGVDSMVIGNARCVIPVNWRGRAFADVVGEGSGNTVAIAVAEIDMATLLPVCSPSQAVFTPALAAVIIAINTAIRAINSDFIALRTALFRACPDPRYLGLTIDPRDPADFCFNTWHHFGMTARWGIPGIGEEDGAGEGKGEGVRAEAMRKAQGEWDMNTRIFLPPRVEGEGWEVWLSLDAGAMKALCEEGGWGMWVDGGVGGTQGLSEDSGSGWAG